MTNGTGKTVQWIMGVIAMLLVGAAGFILQGIHSQQQAQKAVQDILVDRLNAQGDRVTRLEARVDARREREDDINERLKAIEGKVDSLLRRRQMSTD